MSSPFIDTPGTSPGYEENIDAAVNACDIPI